MAVPVLSRETAEVDIRPSVSEVSRDATDFSEASRSREDSFSAAGSCLLIAEGLRLNTWPLAAPCRSFSLQGIEFRWLSRSGAS
jgi:hypothetical protein